MAVFLALLTALAYGVGDFSGGLAARRASPLTVTATAHLIGLIGLVVVAAIVGAEAVRPSDLGRGAVAGICGCIGVVLLYKAIGQRRDGRRVAGVRGDRRRRPGDLGSGRW